jgi:hypothetical protein
MECKLIISNCWLPIMLYLHTTHAELLALQYSNIKIRFNFIETLNGYKID